MKFSSGNRVSLFDFCFVLLSVWFCCFLFLCCRCAALSSNAIGSAELPTFQCHLSHCRQRTVIHLLARATDNAQRHSHDVPVPYRASSMRYINSSTSSGLITWRNKLPIVLYAVRHCAASALLVCVVVGMDCFSSPSFSARCWKTWPRTLSRFLEPT